MRARRFSEAALYEYFKPSEVAKLRADRARFDAMGSVASAGGAGGTQTARKSVWDNFDATPV